MTADLLDAIVDAAFAVAAIDDIIEIHVRIFHHQAGLAPGALGKTGIAENLRAVDGQGDGRAVRSSHLHPGGAKIKVEAISTVVNGDALLRAVIVYFTGKTRTEAPIVQEFT